MPETTNIVHQVIEALKTELEDAVIGSNIVTWCTGYDYRHADEERDGILGQWLPVPTCIVRAEMGDSTNAVLRVSVTVRHDQEVSTLQLHNTDVRIVCNALYALAPWDVEITDTATIQCGILEQSFSPIALERVGRAYETKVMFTVTVTGGAAD